MSVLVSSKIVWYLTLGLFLAWLVVSIFGCSSMTERERYCHEQCVEIYPNKPVVKAEWLGEDTQWRHTRCACTIKVSGGTIVYHITVPLQTTQSALID